MALSRETTIRVAIEHLIRSIEPNDVSEHWPAAAYKSFDQPVWSVPVPSQNTGVGGQRIIVVSRETGAVLADGYFGE
jgi:hypothetical protein